MNKNTALMINGENIIYHYIQKTLLTDNNSDEFTKELIERFIIDLSIWIPPAVYNQIPVLLPYVIRDSTCRKKNDNNEKDEWGYSNKKGLLRDDNSLIKGIIKSFTITGNRVKDYDNKKLANGFVACHIWRGLKIHKQKLASTYEKTNSFIPNLVWLPKQISKLTDREGSYAQKLLQTISYKLYYNDNINSFKQEIWNELDNPNISTKINIDTQKLNFFDISESWINKNINGLLSEIESIKEVLYWGVIPKNKVKCSFYLPTLVQNISDTEKGNLGLWLEENIKEITNNGR